MVRVQRRSYSTISPHGKWLSSRILDIGLEHHLYQVYQEKMHSKVQIYVSAWQLLVSYSECHCRRVPDGRNRQQYFAALLSCSVPGVRPHNHSRVFEVRVISFQQFGIDIKAKKSKLQTFPLLNISLVGRTLKVRPPSGEPGYLSPTRSNTLSQHCTFVKILQAWGSQDFSNRRAVSLL